VVDTPVHVVPPVGVPVLVDRVRVLVTVTVLSYAWV
jgi:hypothetical protein